MYGLTRGLTTLTGIAVAGFLLWLATQLDADVNGDYWAQIGLVAAAGLTIALSQLLGGWTKWGWPRLTVGVLVLGFVPALVVGGLVLLAAQPDDGAFGAGWADTLGLEEIAEDLTGVVLAIAFGLGLALGLTFDTTGPRVRTVEGNGYDRGYGRPIASHDEEAADEPTTAEQRAVAAGDGDRPRDRDEVVERDETADREEEYAVAGEDRRPRRGLFRR